MFKLLINILRIKGVNDQLFAKSLRTRALVLALLYEQDLNIGNGIPLENFLNVFVDATPYCSYIYICYMRAK